MTESTTTPKPALARTGVLHPNDIPAELRSSPRWVGWVGDRNKKSFVSCRTGQPVGIEDVDEFVSFEEAVAAHRKGTVFGLAYASDGSYSVVHRAGNTVSSGRAPMVRSYAEPGVVVGTSTLDAQVVVRANLPPGIRRGKVRRFSRYFWSWQLTTGPQFIPLAGMVYPWCPRTIEDFQAYVETLSRRGVVVSGKTGRVVKG